MKKVTITRVEENVPFDWKELERYLMVLDCFDPSDDRAWEEFIDTWTNDTFSKEELLSVKDKIIEFEKEHTAKLKQQVLEDYIGKTIEDVLYHKNFITMNDIIEYIKKYYE